MGPVNESIEKNREYAMKNKGDNLSKIQDPSFKMKIADILDRLADGEEISFGEFSAYAAEANSEADLLAAAARAVADQLRN